MLIENAPIIDLTIRTVALSTLAMVIVLAATRVVGLRSFSKMTAFDFVTSVAIGSLLAGATVATKWPTFFQNAGAILVILAIQMGLAIMRRQSKNAQEVISNNPVLLVKNSQWHLDALEKTRVSRSDVWAKLREANVCTPEEVRAVILETTGDMTVIHGEIMDDCLLADVTCMGERTAPLK